MSQKPRPPSVEALESLAIDALASDTGQFAGAYRELDGSLTPTTRIVSWDISGNCRSPVPVVLSSSEGRYISRKRPRMTVNLQAPCRRCDVCMRKRAYLWRTRAISEIEQAERTWFVTLTFRPEEHYRMELQAFGPYGPDLAGLAESAKSRLLAKEAAKELTKFLKRLREAASVPLRYLAVTEYHMSAKTSPEMRGRPHLHLLIHELAGQPVRKSAIVASWTLGHLQAKLVDGNKAALYIAKYLSKETDVRIRASQNYGRNESETVNDDLDHSVRF